jgi:hypothetical protein
LELEDAGCFLLAMSTFKEVLKLIAAEIKREDVVVVDSQPFIESLRTFASTNAFSTERGTRGADDKDHKLNPTTSTPLAFSSPADRFCFELQALYKANAQLLLAQDSKLDGFLDVLKALRPVYDAGRFFSDWWEILFRSSLQSYRKRLSESTALLLLSLLDLETCSYTFATLTAAGEKSVLTQSLRNYLLEVYLREASVASVQSGADHRLASKLGNELELLFLTFAGSHTQVSSPLGSTRASKAKGSSSPLGVLFASRSLCH